MNAAVARARRPARPAAAEEAATHAAELRTLVATVDRASGPDASAFRKAAALALAGFLAARRAEARARLDDDGRGMACAEFLSSVQDLVVRTLHQKLVERLAAAKGPPPPLAVVAVGGYGRGALAPHSDIDLLFVAAEPAEARTKLVVESLLYVLWDLKQKVGHATRSVEDCLVQARADMTIRTSILEARLLSGDSRLFEDMRRRFDTQIVARSAGEFVAAKLAERDQRIKRQGESRYLVEPNVKEGKGGLRDLNTLFWIAKYTYRVEDPAELVGVGLFTAEELKLFRRCEQFLWAVRCHLHFLADRPEERLSFDVQPAIGKLLGYANRAGQSDVERFMKHYFLVAKQVGDLTAIVCAALEVRQTKRPQTLDRFLAKLRKRPQAVAEAPDFRVDVERVNVVSDDAFEKDPVNLIRLYWVADRSGLPVHPEATRLVTQSLRRIDAALRNDATANRLFLEILTSRRAPEAALRHMNESGVLGRFIPDFGRVVGMMQYSMYHHFTVDEHLLRTVGVLNQIESGRLVEDHPLLSEILPQIAHRTALYVAAFLHDIAKGRGIDHSIGGAEVARRLCPRLGLNAADTERVAWLIQEHLTMSNTAQGRDISDPRTAHTFGSVVQTLDRLRLLLALTVADIRAVGPGVWNAWKGQLLRSLYWETEVTLGGGHSAIDRNSRVAASREALRKALPNWSDPEFEAYSSRHYPPYWLKVDLARRVEHARLFHAMTAQVRSLTTEVSTDVTRGVTELTVIAPDHPRLLAIVAGACASAAANIVDAHIFTTTDGFALDSIFISRALPEDSDEMRRGRRIAETVEKTLRGEMRLRDAIQDRSRREARNKTFEVEPEVEIDNSLSGLYTVLQVSALDRLGLLYDVTTELSRLNLNIASAHVVTFGEKAVDSFYVTDLTGAKITSPQRQAAIKRRLLAILQGDQRA
jgi:[protein-PII] uridylyltransferase